MKTLSSYELDILAMILEDHLKQATDWQELNNEEIVNEKSLHTEN